MIKKTCDKCGRDEKDEQVPLRRVSVGAFVERVQAVTGVVGWQTYQASATETVYMPASAGKKRDIDLCESCFDSFVNGELQRYLDGILK